jgi:general stress protein 26
VLDDRDKTDGVGRICFTTGDESIKAQNIQRDNRVCICVDDQTPPFTFVTLHGKEELMPYERKEVLKWATKIAGRYMGKKNAKSYGKRNSGDGALLVRIKPTKIIGEKNIAGWD